MMTMMMMMMMKHIMRNIEIIVGSPVFAVPSLKSAQCEGRELCIHAQHQTGFMLQSQALCCLTFTTVLRTAIVVLTKALHSSVF